MANLPRQETELQAGTQRIQDRWVSIRRTELQPLQFHVGHGLVLLTVCAVILALARGVLTGSDTEEKLALQVEAAGGVVTWEKATLEMRPHIVAVNFQNQPVAAGLLKQVVQQRHLRDLYLQNCRLLDSDITSLNPSASLTRIQLDQNPISDTAVLHLARLPNLEVLDLQGCSITDASLRGLGKSCGNLWQLRLDDTAVTNTGLQSISRLHQLRFLGLNGTRVSDPGMMYLRELTKLVRLELDRTDVSDSAIETMNAILPKQPATR